MKLKSCFWLLFALLLAVACTENEDATITFDSSVENLQIDAKKDARLDISFTADSDWEATVDVDWLTVSPTRGGAGQATLSLFAKEENRTGAARKATLNLLVGGNVVQSVVITQNKQAVLEVEQTHYEVPTEGGNVEIVFRTEVDAKWLTIKSDVRNLGEWLSFQEDADTRVVYQGKVGLTVAPNNGRWARKASFQLCLLDENEQEVASSDSITLEQEGIGTGVSTDMVTDDKQVVQLQQHSQGNGIPLVLMGDGFLDSEIQDGYYRQVMEKTLDNLFTEEPVKSLREYFDVWMVTAVSKNNAFGDGYSTKFECWLEGGNSTLIEGNSETVQAYVQEVETLKGSLLQEATVVVVLNTDMYAGTAYFGYGDDAGNVYEFSICYCPTIDGLESEDFRRVLCHEAIGHAFAKLYDEYAYEEQGTIPAEEVEECRMVREWGWCANVDFTQNHTQVLWSHLLSDARYQGEDAWGETLGTYLGACTYAAGAWRPTYESMMRGNTHGFNAPSREAIYKRVMKTAHGEAWTYDYETFVTFDQAHLPQPATTRAAEMGASKPFAAPRFVKRPLLRKR